MKFHEHDNHFKLYKSVGDEKIGVLNISFCAFSIGQPKGKKAMIDHSLCMEHHF